MTRVSPGLDSDLPVDAARRGDARAWDVLFRRYQAPLFAYVDDLVHHHATSLDIVQDAMIRASCHLANLREDARFGSWLFSIAHQLVVRHWRREGRSPFSDEPVPEESTDGAITPDLRTIQEEDASGLLAAIDQLPTAQRSVVLLHFLEDFPLAEIAEITGTSTGTVKSRLHYAKLALRRILRPTNSPTPHENQIPT